MKITLISPNLQNLQEMQRILQADGGHQITCLHGGRAHMKVAAQESQPDLMLLEGMCCDNGELDQVEEVTSQYPSIAVILSCANQSPEFLLQAMRAGVREVLSCPCSAAALLDAVNRIAMKRGAASRNGRVLAFLPCKGGSGATFIATNLGYQLAQEKSVLLIDLNLQFGDALSLVHDEKPTATLADLAANIRRLDTSLLASSVVRVGPNYSVLAAPEDPSQAVEIKAEHVDAVLTLAAAQYDFVLLDMARNLDTLSIRALDRAWRIYPVLQASLPFIRNASKFLAVCRSLNYPLDRIEPIVNRFERTSELSLADIQRTLGKVTLRTVANSYKDVNAAVNQGNPLATIARSSNVARNLAELAACVNPKQGDTRGVLGRLFKWA